MVAQLNWDNKENSKHRKFMLKNLFYLHSKSSTPCKLCIVERLLKKTVEGEIIYALQ